LLLTGARVTNIKKHRRSIMGIVRSTFEKIYKLYITIKHPALRASYSIFSHLTTEERYQLYRLARGKKSILEIGSYLGASATCFAAAQKNQGFGKTYCIDTWNNDAMTEGKMDTYTAFKKNVSPFADHVVPVRGFSTDVVGDVSKYTPTIDLLFIDGDHSYEGVKADWDTYKSFLRENSVVVFHDIGWAEGVKKLIREEIVQTVSESNALPNLWWGTLKGKT
jgi:predicted O-methyltransferase YrrM